jgi:hypothetical protein
MVVSAHVSMSLKPGTYDVASHDRWEYRPVSCRPVGIAAVKAAVLGAALQRGSISESQLPSLMADGANLHQASDSSAVHRSALCQTVTGILGKAA